VTPHLGPSPDPPGAGPLVVHVAAAPDPFHLRAAVADRLAGRPVLPGPEAAVADAVLAHVHAVRRRQAGQDRGTD
jgi:hypothetical protein